MKTIGLCIFQIVFLSLNTKFSCHFCTRMCEWQWTNTLTCKHTHFINNNQFVNVRTDFMLIQSRTHANCVAMISFLLVCKHCNLSSKEIGRNHSFWLWGIFWLRATCMVFNKMFTWFVITNIIHLQCGCGRILCLTVLCCGHKIRRKQVRT